MNEILSFLSKLADTQWLFIDGSIAKTHQDAACIANAQEQAMGKSRGEHFTKIYLAVDSGGVPVYSELSGEQIHDVIHADSLVSSSPKPKVVVADKGYDSQALPKFSLF